MRRAHIDPSTEFLLDVVSRKGVRKNGYGLRNDGCCSARPQQFQIWTARTTVRRSPSGGAYLRVTVLYPLSPQPPPSNRYSSPPPIDDRLRLFWAANHIRRGRSAYIRGTPGLAPYPALCIAKNIIIPPYIHRRRSLGVKGIAWPSLLAGQYKLKKTN